MARTYTASASMTARAAWNYQAADEIGTTSDAKDYSAQAGLASGTEADQIDAIVRQRVTVTSGAPVDLDLAALTDPFGQVVDLATVRGVLLVNTSETAEEAVVVGPQGVAGGWTAPWDGDADGKMRIGPGGHLQLADPIDGLAGSQVLRISTSSVTEIAVDVVLLGVKA